MLNGAGLGWGRPVPNPPRCHSYFKRKEGIIRVKDIRFKLQSTFGGKGLHTKRGCELFNEVFSSVMKHSSISIILLTMTTLIDLKLEQLDVNTAFLHGELKEQIYVH